MNQYEIKSPSILKILASGFLFLTVLSIGSWFGFKTLQDNKPIIGQKPEVSNDDSVKAKTFYNSIGNAPKVKKPNFTKNKAFNKPQYTIDLKIVSTEYDANKILKILSKRGIQSFYTPFRQNGKVYYKVRSGYFSTKKKALTSARKIQKHVKLQARVSTL